MIGTICMWVVVAALCFSFGVFLACLKLAWNRNRDNRKSVMAPPQRLP